MHSIIFVDGMMVITPSLSLWHILLLKLLFITVAIGNDVNVNAVNNADAEKERQHDKESESSFQCSLYLAPSSIPNSGMGIYITRDIGAEEEILPYADAPSILGCDEEVHGQMHYDYGNGDYVWSAYGQAKFECDELSEAVMNIGSMCNYHTALQNTQPARLEPYNDAILNRFKDPGAGAISYTGGHIFETTRSVKAGEELFCDYGEEWLDGRKGTFADDIPRKSDFEKASSIFQTMKENLQNRVDISDTLLQTIKDAVAATDPRVAAALPGTKESFDYVLKNSKLSTPASSMRYLKALAQRTIESHDVKWIEEHGFCLEKIRPGMSKIQGAGKGAFSQGFIEAGEVISLAPLLAFSDKESLNMYNLTRNEETGKLVHAYDDDDNLLQVIGKQLLLNYCFGSSLVQFIFCPLTNAILINHKSYKDSRDGPNARIEWDYEYDHTQQWLDLSREGVTDMISESQRGMTLRIVANRNISPGEEITIDYGTNWEKAWEDHVLAFEPPINDGSYVPVRTMIDNKDFRTIHDLKHNPYPKNVVLACFLYDDDESEEEDDELDGYDLDEDDGSVHDFSEDDISITIEDYLPCELIHKNQDSSYKVRILETSRVYDNYPESSLSFRIAKYTSDTFLPGAFRHYIELPDDMIPMHWR